MSAAISVELIAKMWRDHANCTWVVHATEVTPGGQRLFMGSYLRRGGGA